MKIAALFIAVFFAGEAACSKCPAEQRQIKGEESPPFTQSTTSAVITGEGLEKYQALKDEIEKRRTGFEAAYRKAGSRVEREKTIKEAGEYVRKSIINDLIPFWFGTKWDFNGHSENPGEGTISCGVFVTTLLRHAGFRIPRIAMSQQPAEFIAMNLMSENSIKRFPNLEFVDFLKTIRKMGPAFYIVGLDNHVGFLDSDGKGICFHHSSFLKPIEVIKENAEESSILQYSKYRMVGNLADEGLIRKWITGKKIQITCDWFKSKKCPRAKK